MITGFLIWVACDAPLIDINSKFIGIAILWFALLYLVKEGENSMTVNVGDKYLSISIMGKNGIQTAAFKNEKENRRQQGPRLYR